MDLAEKWQEFLTDRDKEHDKLWGKKELNGFGSKPALLLIDIYYSVLGLKREPIFESMKLWPGSTGLDGWAAVDKSAILLAAARENGIPVIHVKGKDKGPHNVVKAWSSRKPGKSKPNPLMTPEMEKMEKQIVDEVRPLPGELVIEKYSPSAFPGTPLMFQLNSLGIDTLIVCGETTSGCVRASVVDGAAFRFKIGVVEECVFDRTQSSHYLNLYDMHNKYADVVTLEYAKSYLESIGAANKQSVSS
jgi:nicotinamidase-related amidase